MTNADYYRGLAEDCLFATRQSSAKDVKDACMKDAAHFRALAERIERRSKTDKKGPKASIDLREEVRSQVAYMGTQATAKVYQPILHAKS